MCVVRLEIEGLLVGGDGLRILARVVEIDIAEAEVGRRVIFLQRDGFGVSLYGILVSLELAVSVAKLVVRLCIIASFENRLIKRGDGLRVLLRLVERPAKLVVSLH